MILVEMLAKQIMIYYGAYDVGASDLQSARCKGRPLHNLVSSTVVERMDCFQPS